MRSLATMFCLTLATASAEAATFLDGAYGNKEGCIYAKTGESSGADTFFLLNDKGMTTAMAQCLFKAAAVKTATGFTVRGQCEAEGETGPEDTVTLKRTAEGYTVSFPDGTTWGPLAQCR